MERRRFEEVAQEAEFVRATTRRYGGEPTLIFLPTPLWPSSLGHHYPPLPLSCKKLKTFQLNFNKNKRKNQNFRILQPSNMQAQWLKKESKRDLGREPKQGEGGISAAFLVYVEELGFSISFINQYHLNEPHFPFSFRR